MAISALWWSYKLLDVILLRGNYLLHYERDYNMRIVDTVTRILQEILIFIRDIASAIIKYAYEFLLFLYEKFLEIPIIEKIIVINTIPAFFAVILPVARYYIFKEWYYINNPLAVYMIGIVLLMLISTLIRYTWLLVLRLLVNMYYLFWVIYLPAAGELTKADPFQITAGYYVNIAVPATYILAVIISFISYRE